MSFSNAYLNLILLCSVPTYALTTFDTNCTLPYVSYNYVSGPNIRSTLDITWSSLATIIACTFTVLHLNVPEQREGRDPGWLGNLKWWWKGIQPTIQWTLTTIVEPEFYALMAIDALHAARRTRTYLSGPNSRHSSHQWTLVQAFYINMGGYAVRSQEKSKPLQSSPDDRGTLTHLGARAFCMLLRDGILELDDLLTDDEIADRAKSDALAKGLAVLQILYFCTNCIVRVAKQLPLSPLEIGTLGFAFCSVISWGCLFSKPRSVRTAAILKTSVFDLAGHIQPAIEDERLDYTEPGWGASVPNDQLDYGLARRALPPIALAFGAIHFVAWNFPFPTLIDEWLWHVCVIMSTVSLPMGYLLSWIPILARHVDEASFVSGSRAFYDVSRVVLLVVMVRCLFYLPPESFVNTWAANLPHV